MIFVKLPKCVFDTFPHYFSMEKVHSSIFCGVPRYCRVYIENESCQLLKIRDIVSGNSVEWFWYFVLRLFLQKMRLWNIAEKYQGVGLVQGWESEWSWCWGFPELKMKMKLTCLSSFN